MNCAKGLLEASGQLCGGHELLLMKCNQQPGIGRRQWAMDLWIFVHHIYRLLSAHHHSSRCPKGFPYVSIGRSFESWLLDTSSCRVLTETASCWESEAKRAQSIHEVVKYLKPVSEYLRHLRNRSTNPYQILQIPMKESTQGLSEPIFTTTCTSNRPTIRRDTEWTLDAWCLSDPRKPSRAKPPTRHGKANIPSLWPWGWANGNVVDVHSLVYDRYHLVI